jgi:thiol-disulfide isomerase/thioredoxin
MLRTAILSLSLALPLTAAAQSTPEAATAKAEPTLKVGSAAPAFQVESFVKGEAFSSFEKGRVYVVEFWATWCGPCVSGTPHLSGLQREFADRGVTIVGVNVWEDPEYTTETLAKVRTFVEKRARKMDYAVAFDGASKAMDTAWMKAAGRDGIPSAFVVDANGTIAWIGHPASLDMVLDEVTAGRWDVATGTERVKNASKTLRESLAKYREGVEAGDAAWKDAAAKFPMMARTMGDDRYGAVLKAGHFAHGYALGRSLLEEGKAHDDPSMITSVVTPMLDTDNPLSVIDEDLAREAGQAAFERSDPTRPGPHMALAQVHFLLGEMDKGRAACAKAVELAPENLRERYTEWGKELEAKARKK